MNNEGLHPQNWRLELKNGVKGPELGRDGLATSVDELKNQLDKASQALDRAKADRADMDDQPNLSESSSIKVEDLPVADEDDKAYMDSEVAKAQEKVDRIQAKLEIADRIKKIESVIESLKSRTSELKQNKEQLDALKRSVVDLAGDDKDGISSGFDDMLNRIDQQIALLDSQKTNLGVFLILGEANLRGEFSDEDVAAVREILKDGASLLTDEIRDRALRIAEKTKRSQIKDAKELSELRAKVKTSKGVDLALLNREIVLLEKSLANAGVDANNEEQMDELLSLVVKKPNDGDQDKSGVDNQKEIDNKEDVSNSEDIDPAEAVFTEKFVESGSLLTSLEEAINKLDKNSPNFDEVNRIIALLDANAKEVELAILAVKDEETKQKYQERWGRKGVFAKIEAARKTMAELTPNAEAEQQVDEEDATEPESTEADEVVDNEEENIEKTEVKPRFPRITRIFNSIRNRFMGGLGWLDKNASGHIEDKAQVKDSTSIEVEVDEDEDDEEDETLTKLNDPVYHSDLGNTYYRAGRYEEAIKEKQEAIRLDAKNSIYHFGLGLSLNKAGRYEEAIKAFQDAINLSSNHPHYYNNLGVAFRNAGRDAEADKQFQIAKDLEQDSRGAEVEQTESDPSTINELSESLPIFDESDETTASGDAPGIENLTL